MVLAIKSINLEIGYHDEETDEILWAVRGVDIQVEEAESFCLVGESGCGKSTFASAVTGILPPHTVTRGKLYIYENLVLDESKHNYNGIRGRIVSLIPQNPGTGLNPFLTIEDHFYYVLRDIKGLRKEETRKIADKYLSLVGLNQDILDSYPHELSGGMQQRVAIAIALASDVKIIVADEPTSSIDANLRAQIIWLINKLIREHGVTLLMVTHDIQIASRVCDKIGVMYAGKIIEYGSTRSILINPRHPYTKMLLEIIPVLGSKKLLKPLPGEPEYMYGKLEQCPFIDRCPFKIERCSMEPPLHQVEENTSHYARCWRYKEVF